MKKVIHGSRAFRYFIVSYILLVICVELPICGVLLKVKEANMNQASNISKLELDKYGTELDYMISAAAETTIQISRQSDLKKVAYVAKNLKGTYAYDCYIAKEELRKIQPVTYSFDNGFLYYSGSDIVVTYNGVYHSAESFCKLALNESYDDFMRMFEGESVKNKIVGLGDKLCVINQVIFEYPVSKKSYSCFYINKSHLNSILNNESYIILDSSNNVVMSSLTTEEIGKIMSETLDKDTCLKNLNGADVMISKQLSKKNNAVYITIYPVNAIKSMVRPLNRLLIISMSVIFVISILVGCKLSFNNTKLIRGFMNEVSPEPSDEILDEFDSITKGIQTLRTNNMQYQELLAKLKTSLTAAFYIRLYNNLFSDERELIDAMDDACVTLKGDRYTIVLIVCEGENISEKVELNAMFSDNVFITPVGANKYVMLLSSSSDEALKKSVEQMSNRLPAYAKLYAAEPYEKLIDTHIAFKQALDLSENTADETETGKATEPDELEMQIRMFIADHLTNVNLSLTMIADHLGMSESYLSIYFKKHSGKNISSYIEQLRIDRSYQLIKNTDLQIKDIADRVGYTSDISFRRAFKKVMGCTPSDVRNE